MRFLVALSLNERLRKTMQRFSQTLSWRIEVWVTG